MTELVRFHRFRRRYLALTIGLMMLPTAHAMQELSDHSLSDTTGEGVALVLDNFKMVFQGPNDLSAGSSYARDLTDPSQYDTGFIRIIPTGENYQQLSDRAFENTYQSTYDAQYQTSFTALKDSEYKRVYETQFNNEYQRLRNIKYDEFRTAEFNNSTGTLYKQRYDYWSSYHGIGGDGDYIDAFTRPRKAREKAENDLNNVQEWKDKLHNKVEGKLNESTEVNQLTNQARPTAETNSNNLATQYAQNNAQQHTNQQIRYTINSATDMGNRKTKADVFIYGLALSKSDGSLSTRFSNQGFNWGSADNPWLFRAGSQIVKQFTDEAKEIGYLALEAPLATVVGSEADNNIKLGFWTDIFARGFNSSNEVDPITGGPKEGLDANERLRLQFVANGLSLNGSQVRIFQTLQPDLTDVDLTKSENYLVKNQNYFQTLGIASLIRLNTDDQPNNVNFVDSVLEYVGSKTDAEITQLRNKTDAELKQLGLNRNVLSDNYVQQARNALISIGDYSTKNASLNAKGIRLSTATLGDLDAEVATPAMKSGALAPLFQETEGLYLYSPNINLVLGNMYQPLVLGSKENNIIIEVTQIPNVADIYNQIYQKYPDIDYRVKNGNDELVLEVNPDLLKGSTCNVYSCGTSIKANSSDTVGSFQGRNATHSSIAIGTVERLPHTNMLRAKDDVTSTGVVFKDAAGNSKNFGSAVIDGVLIQHLKITTTGL